MRRTIPAALTMTLLLGATPVLATDEETATDEERHQPLHLEGAAESY